MKLDIYITKEDTSYLSFLKMLLGPHSLSINYGTPPTISGALLGCDGILVCDPAFIKKLTFKAKCNHEDYFGSLWIRQDIKGRKIPILVLPPLKRLVSTKPGVFLARRYLSKIFTPKMWFSPSHFKWTLCNDLISSAACYTALADMDVIAVDIETSPAYRNWEEKTDPQHIITCVGYSGITFDDDGNSFSCNTFVIPLDSMEQLKWIRKINSLPQPKIFQNGKYDNFYFLRFGAPVKNWIFDLMEAHHCIYAELPKSLGYLAPFYLREVSYWKDEGRTGNLHDFYEYNAKDAWATANAFLSWIQEAPDWAIKNYLIKWGLIYPCFACELDGLSIDTDRLQNVRETQTEIQSKTLSSLTRKLGKSTFNPASPKQVLQLLHLLGNKMLTNADVKALEIAADRHPLARLLIDEITEYRRSTKLISTYIDAELWPPRINGNENEKRKLLYTLNPSGTDTGRLASRESQLWCGTQLQNLPEYYKQVIRAEEGFFLGEGDFEQSETRCTAYLSGDEHLIAAVESEQDFHATNASAFFGIPYSEIVGPNKSILNRSLRDLAKRVNHGSNYNMGDAVLLATMGMKNVLRAKTLLNLPEKMTPKEVCQHLLKTFSDTYPKVKHEFYESIIAAIKLSKRLTSELGWTRLCFGTPWNSKPDLNAYVAHVPSNLSVGIINEAFQDIFWQVHVPSGGEFRLKGQIHDSILFAYKEGRLDLVEKVARLMTRPKIITDCSGQKREMKIPVAMKAEARTWTDLKKLPQFTF